MQSTIVTQANIRYFVYNIITFIFFGNHIKFDLVARKKTTIQSIYATNRKIKSERNRRGNCTQKFNYTTRIYLRIYWILGKRKWAFFSHCAKPTIKLKFYFARVNANNETITKYVKLIRLFFYPRMIWWEGMVGSVLFDLRHSIIANGGD